MREKTWFYHLYGKVLCEQKMTSLAIDAKLIHFLFFASSFCFKSCFLFCSRQSSLVNPGSAFFRSSCFIVTFPPYISIFWHSYITFLVLAFNKFQSTAFKLYSIWLKPSFLFCGIGPLAYCYTFGCIQLLLDLYYTSHIWWSAYRKFTSLIPRMPFWR